jgi:hypothetical protein
MSRRDLPIRPNDDSAVERFVAVRTQHAKGWIAGDVYLDPRFKSPR